MEQKEQKTILSVQDLEISFKTDDGLVHAVRGVSFDLKKEETLCIVGESGSGKSVTSKTIMGILPNSAIIEGGHIYYEGEDLTKISEDEFHRIRGNKIGMIFQDPLSSLNPIKKVGIQITETMLVNGNKMMERYKKLIAVDEANFNNVKIQRNSKIAKAKNAVMNSDSSFDDKIRALEVKKREYLDELDLLKMKKDQKAYDAKKKEYQDFMKTYSSSINGFKKQKKAEHKRLKKLIPGVVKEANETFKKDYPVFKKKFEDAKKRAVISNGIYRKKLEDGYKKDLELLVQEEKETTKKYDTEISKLRSELSKASSRVLAKQQIDELVKEKEEALKAIEKKREVKKEGFKNSFQITKKAAKAKALEVMKEVGIPQPEIRFKQYPFEFSGGMRQRIVIAIALVANPEILICDEPTTALDVTIQAQILELINKLKRQRHMSVIFISHDLGVVANMADRVAVMYAGKIVEVGTVNEVFYDPRHPYTWALLSSIPDLDSHEKLEAIPGTPPYLLNPPKGDAFATRNKYAMAVDFKEEPPFFQISDTHYAATWLLDKRAPSVEKPRIVSQRIKANLKKAGINNVSELEGK